MLKKKTVKSICDSFTKDLKQVAVAQRQTARGAQEIINRETLVRNIAIQEAEAAEDAVANITKLFSGE